MIAAVPALLGLGLVLIAVSGGFLLASFSAGRLASAIERISDATVTISGNTEGLEAVASVVKFEGNVEDVVALDKVMKNVTKVLVESRTANVPALQAIAQAVTPQATGGSAAAAAASGGGRQSKTVQLVLNDRVLGDVIVDLLNDKYDLTL